MKISYTITAVVNKQKSYDHDPTTCIVYQTEYILRPNTAGRKYYKLYTYNLTIKCMS